MQKKWYGWKSFKLKEHVLILCASTLCCYVDLFYTMNSALARSALSVLNDHRGVAVDIPGIVCSIWLSSCFTWELGIHRLSCVCVHLRRCVDDDAGFV